MPPRATPIELTEQERQTLTQWTSAGTTEHRLVERAQIILLAAEGNVTRRAAYRFFRDTQGRTFQAGIATALSMQEHVPLARHTATSH